ncbi:MAG: NAD(P)/FAD-dependent oxidoreductase [Pseudomonadota bacterium]
MKIGVIGAGISAIAFARVLKRFSHEVIIFEKADCIGGIWAQAYPEVRLQNSYEQYHLSDLGWPEQPDQHPTARQILDYMNMAVSIYKLDVRLQHEVLSLNRSASGWSMLVNGEHGEERFDFDFVVVSIGQYNEGKHRPEFAGEDDFAGTIITERDVKSLEQFRDQRVAVVGFGKSAVDMASFAARKTKAVTHVFRTPRWLIPFHPLGVHYSRLLFARASTVFMPCWVHSGGAERWIHTRAGFVVRRFWKLIEGIVRRHISAHAKYGDENAKARLACVTPAHDFERDMRSATAMAPIDYFKQIATGDIEPHHQNLKGFNASGLVLEDGSELEADTVVLSVGSKTPSFPFFDDEIRELIERENDGLQLYRHLIHPDIPDLAFAGYNHGFLHIPTAEIGALWIGAMLEGDFKLPSAPLMHASIDRIRDWKRAHVQYEPSRSCAVSTRFQQYLDAMLRELGISPFRKLPNVFAEFGARYGAADYAGVVDEYLAKRNNQSALDIQLSLDM